MKSIKSLLFSSILCTLPVFGSMANNTALDTSKFKGVLEIISAPEAPEASETSAISLILSEGTLVVEKIINGDKYSIYQLGDTAMVFNKLNHPIAAVQITNSSVVVLKSESPDPFAGLQMNIRNSEVDGVKYIVKAIGYGEGTTLGLYDEKGVIFSAITDVQNIYIPGLIEETE